MTFALFLHPRAATCVFLLAALASGAHAQSIFKCAEPGGGVAYQEDPCPHGQQLGTLARDVTIPSSAALAQMDANWLALRRAQDARREREAAIALAQSERQSLVPPADASPLVDYAYGPPLYYAPAHLPHHAHRAHHRTHAALDQHSRADPAKLPAR